MGNLNKIKDKGFENRSAEVNPFYTSAPFIRPIPPNRTKFWKKEIRSED